MSANHRPCTSNLARMSPRLLFLPKCCMKVPFNRLPRPVSAAERTNTADAANGKNNPGAAGVTSSIARATSSNAFVNPHHRFGSSSYFWPPNDPARSVATEPTPSLSTHFAAAVSGNAPGVDPIPSATNSDCADIISNISRNNSDTSCQRNHET